MNACGQHTIADIGFQGMTLKSNGKIAPATQILLGGGAVGNADGHFADKVLKVPSKRTPDVLRWLLIDFENHHRKAGESFLGYYQRVGSDYFYQISSILVRLTTFSRKTLSIGGMSNFMKKQSELANVLG